MQLVEAQLHVQLRTRQLCRLLCHGTAPRGTGSGGGGGSVAREAILLQQQLGGP